MISAIRRGLDHEGANEALKEVGCECITIEVYRDLKSKTPPPLGEIRLQKEQ